MPVITDPLFWVLAIPAFILTGISKGGFASGAGNVAVPLMALAIPAPQAAGIALPLLCAMDISDLRAWWGKWSARELRATLPGGLLGIAVGAALFGMMSDAAIKLMVGVIALAFLARAACGRRDRAGSRPRPRSPAGCAAASGARSPASPRPSRMPAGRRWRSISIRCAWTARLWRRPASSSSA